MRFVHGLTVNHKGHPLYWVWHGMKKRCLNTKSKHYNDYGERGIKICKRWVSDPYAFFCWAMRNGYKKGLYLDRKNNDGNYSPQNCRFVTAKESVHNQRLIQKNNTSGYRGVGYWNNRWIARMTIDGRMKHLGCFKSPRLAALRYDAEAYRLDDGRPRNIF